MSAEKTNHYNILSAWCGSNGLFVRSNREVFFINERILMKPEYVINEKVYIDLVDEKELTDKYLTYCEIFSNSYGTIIVIPKTILPEIKTIKKTDLEREFNIKF